MSTFAFLLLCIQASLIQAVYSQCLGAVPGLAMPAMAPLGAPWGAPALAAPGLGWAGLAGPAIGAYGGVVAEPFGAYGGSGIGNLAVAGELPVAGTTAVAGQVPIIGAVEFGGTAAAAGAVNIAGSCGCGCGAPFY